MAAVFRVDVFRVATACYMASQLCEARRALATNDRHRTLLRLLHAEEGICRLA